MEEMFFEMSKNHVNDYSPVEKRYTEQTVEQPAEGGGEKQANDTSSSEDLSENDGLDDTSESSEPAAKEKHGSSNEITTWDRPNQRMHGIHGSIIQGNVMNIEKRGKYEKLVCDLYQSPFLGSI